MAVLSYLSDDLGKAPVFDAPRLPLTFVFVTSAVISLAIIVVAVLCRRTAMSRNTPTVLLLSTWLATMAFSGYYGIFRSDTFTGQSHSRAVIACWLLLGAIPLAAMSLREFMTSREKFITGIKTRIAVGALIPIVWTGLATMPWTEPAAAITVTKVDMHPVSSAPVPDRIAIEPTRKPVAARPATGNYGSRQDSDGPRQVGPGLFTNQLELINPDTGTIRWRLNIPDHRTVAIIADNRHSMVVVTDLMRTDGPKTMAVDATSGDIRWTSDTALITLQYQQRFFGRSDQPGYSIVDQDVLLAASDDAWTVRAYSPDDGTELWSYDVGRDCALADTRTRPLLALNLDCTTGPEVRYLNPDTGDLISTQPRGRVLSNAPESIAKRFIWTSVGRGENTQWSITDQRTGRTALKFGATPGDVDGCAENGDCIVTTGKNSAKKSRIVSLTGSHPDVPLADPVYEFSNGPPLWLAGQVVYVGRTVGGNTNQIVVDRHTGKSNVLAESSDPLFAVPGGVATYSAMDSELVRFDGIRG